jgi:hypothetical protein
MERKQFMKTCKPVFRALLVVLAFACIATAADAPKLNFKFKTIDVKNAQQTWIYEVNNRLEMVGYYVDQGGAYHGFFRVGGKFNLINDPNGTLTICNGLNSAATTTIVGDYVDSANKVHAFKYPLGGKFKDVGLHGHQSSALAINDKGEVVGIYFDPPSYIQHGYGYLWNSKKMRYEYQKLNVPGSTSTSPIGITNGGLIVMQWIDSSGNNKGALYNSKTEKYLDTNIKVPGAAQTYPEDINNAGDIVFVWHDSRGNKHSALALPVQGKKAPYKFHKFHDPNGPDYTTGFGINDRHVIVGSFEATGSTLIQGFKATY